MEVFNYILIEYCEYSAKRGLTIGHVNEYPTMHYFGIPRHTQSMIAYKIFWKFQWKIAL